MNRRESIAAGGRLLAGLAVPGVLLAPRPGGRRGVVHEILMRSDARGERVYFDPVGLRVDPGDVIRWVIESNVHTATAYHPANGKPRRIPVGARPWDSGYLVHPGDRYEVTLTVPGVYDYFCLPHEAAGMAGRIVVGAPPFGPDASPADSPDIPEAARRALPAVDRIVHEGRVFRSATQTEARRSPLGLHSLGESDMLQAGTTSLNLEGPVDRPQAR